MCDWICFPRKQFPIYYDELRGTADGADVPLLQVSAMMLLYQPMPTRPLPFLKQSCVMYILMPVYTQPQFRWFVFVITFLGSIFEG